MMDTLTKHAQKMFAKFHNTNVDYKTVFNTAEGERVLADLMKRFAFLTEADGQLDEGGRRVVLHILTQMRMSDDDMRKMLLAQPLLENDDD